MNSPKMYRRIILALLWMMFLMWIHGRNRKTQEEFEAQQEAEFAVVQYDPVVMAIHQKTQERLATPEGQALQKEANRSSAKRVMKKIIEETYTDE